MSSKRFYIAEEVANILAADIPWHENGSDVRDDSSSNSDREKFHINEPILTAQGTDKNESAKWRAQRVHVPYMLYVPYVPYIPTRPTCPTCPRALRALRAHVPKYILQTGKLKKWKLCTDTFFRVLSLNLDLNFTIS